MRIPPWFEGLRSKPKLTKTGAVVSGVNTFTLIPDPSATAVTALLFMSVTVEDVIVINVFDLLDATEACISFKMSRSVLVGINDSCVESEDGDVENVAPFKSIRDAVELTPF